MVRPSTVSMFGYGYPDGMIGLPIRSLFHDPEQREDLKRELQKGREVTDFSCKGL